MNPVDITDELLRARSADAPNGCREWTRGRDWDGYGIVRSRGKSHRAHRAAWELAHKRKIPKGYVVRHTCDNPPCINPDHLVIGTTAANNRDRAKRGRSADFNGENAPSSKLTWPQVDEIRERLAAGESQGSLGRKFNVSRKTISKIAHGETWTVRPDEVRR